MYIFTSYHFSIIVQLSSVPDNHHETNEDVCMVIDEGEGPEYDVLVRCIHGDQQKFSTRVCPSTPSTFPLS